MSLGPQSEQSLSGKTSLVTATVGTQAPGPAKWEPLGPEADQELPFLGPGAICGLPSWPLLHVSNRALSGLPAGRRDGLSLQRLAPWTSQEGGKGRRTPLPAAQTPATASGTDDPEVVMTGSVSPATRSGVWGICASL